MTSSRNQTHPTILLFLKKYKALKLIRIYKNTYLILVVIQNHEKLLKHVLGQPVLRKLFVSTTFCCSMKHVCHLLKFSITAKIIGFTCYHVTDITLRPIQRWQQSIIRIILMLYHCSITKELPLN